MALVSELVTHVKANANQFHTEMNKVTGSTKSMVGGFNAAQVAITAAITAIAASVGLVVHEVFKISDEISKLYDNTQKIQVTVAAFQELAIVAREAGVSSDSLQNLMGIMNKKLGEAQLKGGDAAKALQALGISFRDLDGLSTDKKFELIASKLKNVKDLQVETALATAIFGKSGKDAIGLFNSNIDISIAKIKELGITLSESQAEGLDRLSETKDLIGDVWSGFKANIAAEVTPAFQDLLDQILDAIKNMGGLKNAAESAAEFIVSAMNKMVDAINLAVTSMKIAKGIGDALATNSTGGDSVIAKMFKLAYNLNPLVALYKQSQKPNEGLEKLLSNTMSKNSEWRDGGFIFNKTLDNVGGGSKAGGAAKGAIDQATKSNSMRDLINASQIMVAYADNTKIATGAVKSATESIKAFQKKAQDAADVLDRFNQIKDGFATAGKDQASNIIKQGIEGNRLPLADDTKFKEIFSKALKESQAGDTSNIKDEIKALQDIIDSQKRGPDLSGGGMPESFSYLDKDTSGLVEALNQLKSYLAGKDIKQQQVDVKIKVEASEDFVTNVTTTQTFRQAVDEEIRLQTAEAARGDLT
jgi:hypothetical protein